jgi:hypothetical protein
MKIYVAAFISVIGFFAVSGEGTIAQERPEPVLVDEHGRLPCDDLLGRLDLYFSELSKDPSSVGVAILSSTRGDKRLAVFRQHFIEAHARDRGFTSNPIKFIRTISGDSLSVQLWRVPAGGQEPSVSNVDSTYGLPDTFEPLMFGVEYIYGDDICPEVEDQPIFAKFLEGNPASRGNIVVRDRSIERARRKADRIRYVFRTKYGITSSRLRFFTRMASRSALMREPIVEYWYLP